MKGEELVDILIEAAKEAAVAGSFEPEQRSLARLDLQMAKVALLNHIKKLKGRA